MEVDVQDKPTTTTISTIAVRAEPHTTIVIAMLKSIGFTELRIDEMKPKLLDFGQDLPGARSLMESHNDLVKRLASKQEQVEDLLTRADQLVMEQKDNDVYVYEAMAESLGVAWRELNRQLDLRGYILEDTVSFYELAQQHEQLTKNTKNLLRQALAGPAEASSAGVVRQVQASIHELIGVTVAAVDAGSNIITQIRILGSLGDTAERASEAVEACLLIEKTMLHLAQQWEMIDNLWAEERPKLEEATGVQVSQQVQVAAAPTAGAPLDDYAARLKAIESWIQATHSKMESGPVDPKAADALLQEAQQHEARLKALNSEIQSKPELTNLVPRGRALKQQLDNLLKLLQQARDIDSRTRQFLQNADSLLQQLQEMKSDVANADAAMAGELGPLARQKASTVIHDGEQILRFGANPQVSAKLAQLHAKLAELEQLASERIRTAGKKLVDQTTSAFSWLRDVAEPFIATNGNIGRDLPSATEFVAKHKQFATDVVSREPEIVTLIGRSREVNESDRKALHDFQKRYEHLKHVLEHRISTGNTFHQFHKFARDLEGSFDTLSALLNTNREFNNENVAQQMNNVFHAINSTLTQEQHQGEKFIATVQRDAEQDKNLKVDEAISSVQKILESHRGRLQDISQKWQNWQKARTETKKAMQVIEEIQMWQVDTFEIIQSLANKISKSTTEEERQNAVERLEQIIQFLPTQQQRIVDLHRIVEEQKSEEGLRRIRELHQKQQQLNEHTRKAHDQTKIRRTVEETFVTEETRHIQRAPRVVSRLADAQVEEGSRVEFAAKVDAAPEPKVSWSKDGIDIRGNADYSTAYANGVATLTIEETFIEDTATYTIRVENHLGSAESSAKLTVKSRSALPSQTGLGQQKPLFARQLPNVTVQEGDSVKLDCVIQANPEPQVVWYKEAQSIRESDRIRLQFHGDLCSLSIESANQKDTGLYTVKASNVHGESTNFCRLTVQPRKVPPPTLPKPSLPATAPAHALVAPTFHPPLTNQKLPEGQTAVLEVRVTAQPKPTVTWRFGDQPIESLPGARLVEQPDGWTRVVIERLEQHHAGIYTVEARNEAGEARSGATVNVISIGGPSYTRIEESTTQEYTGSRLVRSDGMWSDGSLGTPSPRPALGGVPGVEELGDPGYSSLANAPSFIRPFQSEYTVNEGEKVKLDCLLVANPRPKVHWFFNDRPARSNYEFTNIGDTYSISFTPAKLENAGHYKMSAENIRGKAESSTVIHVRPKSMIPQPASRPRKPQSVDRQRIVEEYGAYDRSYVVPGKHQRTGMSTPPPAKRAHEASSAMTRSAYQPRLTFADDYGAQYEHQASKSGTPPHFIQTLVSCVATIGDSVRFEAIVTGLPAPEVQWTKDGAPISRQTHPHLEFLNVGGRVSLAFKGAREEDAGKYMCTARNESGVATSSAQFVVRPKTTAPDFLKRLISEEVVEGEPLKWTVRVTGDPPPTVTWLRDNQVIPDCEEVRLVDEGNGVHSLIIQRLEVADSGQFTCLAENAAGEARSTADLVVRPSGTEPGSYFHITKVTQEKQIKGEEVSRNQTFSIENPGSTPL